MLLDLLNKKTIAVSMKAANKDELLKNMMDLASESGNVTDRQKALDEIMQRERIMSTGIGHSIALPHAKTEAVKEMTIAVAITESPVDFDSLDNKPIEIVFLLLGQVSNITEHLKTISEISQLLNCEETKGQMIKAKSSDELLKVLQKKCA